MAEMSHEQAQELLGVFALHAMDDEERLEVAAHVDSCDECRREVHEHFETMSFLVGDGQELPEGLWARISEKLDGELPPLAEFPIGGAVNRNVPAKRSRFTNLLIATTTAAAVLAVVTGVSLIHQTQRLNRAQDAAAAPTLAKTVAAAAANPANRHLSLVSNDGKFVVDAVVDSSGWVFMTGSDLPQAQSGRGYQMWAIVNNQPISLGPMGPDPKPCVFLLPAGATTLAVTDEVATGVALPSQAPIVKGSISA